MRESIKLCDANNKGGWGMKKLKMIDLFAGIGGIRLGFEKHNVKCVFSSEWDKFAQETYEANFNEIPEGDITKIDAKAIPDFDILTAGFPCQPFSSIGKREGFRNKTQGTLFFDIVRIIEEKKPLVVFLENVPGLVNHNKGETFKIILGTLDELGYKTYHKILDSVNFGVPQYRKRIYIVGFRKDRLGGEAEILFNFPKGSNKRVDIGKFIETGIEDRPISEMLQKNYIFKKKDGRPQIIDKDYKNPVNTLVSTYHKIQRLTGIFVRDGKTGLRLLTEKECKAIMGFPKSFKVPVSRTQMYRQFGNAVVVPVIEKISEEIIKTVEGKTKKEYGQKKVTENFPG
jgi:DNA (cytosine-5)-methyltransferase 1